MEKQHSFLSAGILSFQHVLAMFGATVLVPFITGLNPSIALLGAGVGTLLFHAITGGKVPVFLGSSFAFIAGILVVKENFGLAYATGSFLVVGALYLLMALVVYLIGPEKVKKIFPSIVTGPIIIVIGLILAPVAVDMASANWTIAIVTIVAIALTGIIAKGFVRMIPIIVGISVGYIASIAMGIVDFSPVVQAPIFYGPSEFKGMMLLPQFSFDAMKIIVPIALVTMIEHIGDITTNGAVVGKDFFKSPGLHRTLMGDGIATAFAGLIGAPANTTYGENTGVLAVTKNYNPAILRGAAIVAILLSFIGKFGALVQTIPVPVMGGVSFVLFGMIASIGVRTLVDAKPDLSDLRNSIVVFTILIIGIVSIKGEANPAIISFAEHASLSGLSLAAIIGVSLNAVINIIIPHFIPGEKEEAAAKENTAKRMKVALEKSK
ncbi:MAG: uracil transporter [Clostridiaceae bacterium BRH_c20a]|nr:MAG: uracil transporter [Clostridiaceae bacterium BRH_c20a]